LLVGLAFIIYQRVFGKTNVGNYSFGFILVLVALVSGIIISPLAGGDYREAGICSTDIPREYEKIGSELATLIPQGSQVFWDVSTAVPLLYAPDIKVYPAQIYGESSYRNASNSQELLRLGYWNDSLRSDWMNKADYLVIEPSLNSNQSLEINVSQYKVTKLPPLNPCDPNTFLLVYARK
jgi:hypothetical protein